MTIFKITIKGIKGCQKIGNPELVRLIKKQLINAFNEDEIEIKPYDPTVSKNKQRTLGE